MARMGIKEAVIDRQNLKTQVKKSKGFQETEKKEKKILYGRREERGV